MVVVLVLDSDLVTSQSTPSGLSFSLGCLSGSLAWCCEPYVCTVGGLENVTALWLSFRFHLRGILGFLLNNFCHWSNEIRIVQYSLLHRNHVSGWRSYYFYFAEETVFESHRSQFFVNRLADYTLQHGLYSLAHSFDSIVVLGETKAVTASTIKPGVRAIVSHHVAWLTAIVLLASMGRSPSVVCSLDTTWSTRPPSVYCSSNGTRIAFIPVWLPVSPLCERGYARIGRSWTATPGVITGRGEQLGRELFIRWVKNVIGWCLEHRVKDLVSSLR